MDILAWLESWAGALRTGVPRERGCGRHSAEADRRRPQRHWRHHRWTPPQAPRSDRRAALPALARQAGARAPAEAPQDGAALCSRAAAADGRCFVDLVGSTALSAALDPEEMGAAIRVYQNAVAGETLRPLRAI